MTRTLILSEADFTEYEYLNIDFDYTRINSLTVRSTFDFNLIDERLIDTLNKFDLLIIDTIHMSEDSEGYCREYLLPHLHSIPSFLRFHSFPEISKRIKHPKLSDCFLKLPNQYSYYQTDDYNHTIALDTFVPLNKEGDKNLNRLLKYLNIIDPTNTFRKHIFTVGLGQWHADTIYKLTIKNYLTPPSDMNNPTSMELFEKECDKKRRLSNNLSKRIHKLLERDVSDQCTSEIRNVTTKIKSLFVDNTIFRLHGKQIFLPNPIHHQIPDLNYQANYRYFSSLPLVHYGARIIEYNDDTSNFSKPNNSLFPEYEITVFQDTNVWCNGIPIKFIENTRNKSSYLWPEDHRKVLTFFKGKLLNPATWYDIVNNSLPKIYYVNETVDRNIPGHPSYDKLYTIIMEIRNSFREAGFDPNSILPGGKRLGFSFILKATVKICKD